MGRPAIRGSDRSRSTPPHGLTALHRLTARIRGSRLGPLALVPFIALSACAAPAAGRPTASAPSAGARSAEVRIISFRFQPADLEVAAGTTVAWTNDDAILHTVTSGTSTKKDELGNYSLAPDGRFDGPLPDKGRTFSFTFSTAGEYAYFCSRHNNMTARVVVR